MLSQVKYYAKSCNNIDQGGPFFMFNKIFQKPEAIRRYTNAPLLEDRLDL